MKTNFPLFLLFLLLASCQVNSDIEMTLGSFTATASPSQRPEATVTNTVLKAMTPTPLPPTITPSLVPTPSATFTPMPTLTDEQNATVLNLMESNGDCDLPCWWGIIPGKTSAMEARRFLTDLGIQFRELKTTQVPGLDTIVLFTRFEPHPDVNVDFQYIGMKDDVVERLDLGITRYSFGHENNQEQELELKKIWSPLSPENIIRKYGTPSRIFVNYNPGSSGYNLAFLYKTGIYIAYNGSFADNRVKTCPVSDYDTALINHFFITLVNPDAAYNIEKITDRSLLYSGAYDLETVTTITKDDFAKEILRLGEDFCFSVKLKR